MKKYRIMDIFLIIFKLVSLYYCPCITLKYIKYNLVINVCICYSVYTCKAILDIKKNKYF